jgi:hypothetical protein
MIYRLETKYFSRKVKIYRGVELDSIQYSQQNSNGIRIQFELTIQIQEIVIHQKICNNHKVVRYVCALNHYIFGSLLSRLSTN